MGVMAAGVHQTVALAGKRQTGFLGDAQRIDITPQRDRLARLCTLDLGNNAGRLEPAIADPEFIQLLRDPVGGAHLLQAGLRVAMKIPPELDNLRHHLVCKCSDFHTNFPSLCFF